MLTCKKEYRDIPFSHRQHTHSGHCSYIHGHNWGIEITFACKNLDANGFVIDFGKLKSIKNWIESNLDHAILMNESDPEKDHILKSCPSAFKSYIVDNCSCEGLAFHFYEVFSKILSEDTKSRVFIVDLTVTEDSKNSATFCPEL
jgi:6-pyruvoyltetrahydropterin/6-carboxytetrahydropterin synthase|tara:strand:+ start:1525 stop:1959 length:435 start_codon:yes stop_codon:yes gene_type:complete